MCDSFLSVYQQLPGIQYQSVQLATEVFFLIVGSIKYLHEDMDITSFFVTSASSSVASSSTHMEKGSNCSDSDSDIALPPSKKTLVS